MTHQRPHTRTSRKGKRFAAGLGQVRKLPDGFVVENGILYRQVLPNFKYPFHGDPFKRQLKKARRPVRL